MRYLDVRWRQDDAREPVRLISETDKAGYEVRKVEVYADGHADYADQGRSTGDTVLADLPVPRDDEIAADHQFEVRPLSPEAFEAVWRSATTTGTVAGDA